MEIIDNKVSAFSNCYTTTPCEEVEILEWLQRPSHKELVLPLREMSEADYKLHKKMLPAITPMGTFSERNSAGWLTYSGLLCIDIDAADNPSITDWESTKQILGQYMPGLFYAGLSTSGRGLFLLVRSYYMTKYRQTLDRVYAMLEKHNIHPDKRCRDCSRLRFASYDENPYIDMNVKAVDAMDLLSDVFSEKYNKPYTPVKPKISQIKDCGLLELAVRRIEQSQVDITKTYASWFEIGCSIANVTDSSEYFHRISRFHPQYNEAECEAQFQKCKGYRNNYSIATFIYHCAKYNIYLKNSKLWKIKNLS